MTLWKWGYFLTCTSPPSMCAKEKNNSNTKCPGSSPEEEGAMIKMHLEFVFHIYFSRPCCKSSQWTVTQISAVISLSWTQFSSSQQKLGREMVFHFKRGKNTPHFSVELFHPPFAIYCHKAAASIVSLLCVFVPSKESDYVNNVSLCRSCAGGTIPNNK